MSRVCNGDASLRAGNGIVQSVGEAMSEYELNFQVIISIIPRLPGKCKDRPNIWLNFLSPKSPVIAGDRPQSDGHWRGKQIHRQWPFVHRIWREADNFDQIMIFHTTGLDSSRQISYTVKAVTLALFADRALPVIWRREGPGANAT